MLESISEVIDQGKTGFICQIYEEMAQMIPAALALDRHSYRECVENKFSISQMVNGYEAVYQQILQSRIKLDD